MDLSHRKRIFGLDIFRTLAILPVVIGHGGFILEKSGSNFPWIPLYDGVELFFVLSGYLIGGQLISMFCSGENYGWKNIFSFLTRRWLRTLPNYYLILVINILFIYYGVVNGNLEKVSWRFFFFLQNFDFGFTDFFWESWSLSIEEWFYLLFPFFIWVMILIFPKSNRKTAFLTGMLVFILVPLLLRFQMYFNTRNLNDFWLTIKIHRVVIYRLDSIAFGLLAAWIHHYLPSVWNKLKWPAFFVGVGTIVSFFFIEHNAENMFDRVFGNTFSTIGSLLVLPLFSSITTGPQLAIRLFTFTSKITYSMYLINLSVVAMLIMNNIDIKNSAESILLYIAYWEAVIILSALMYRYFEKPIMDLRDKPVFKFA